MKMRSMVSLAGLVVAGFAAVLPAGAADDKALANMKGAVSFSRDGARTPKPVAVHATVTLADKDYAITGADSLAGVTLPDSSRVLVGSDSKVQLGFFNQAAGNNAKFIVFNGKVRFIVQHPAGAKANYTFQTATANVGVRGTEGDVAVQSDGTLTVNVYEVCDSSTPVTVTTKDGARYELNPGQSLVAQMVNGVIRAHVE
ncbi:MAG TPA: FecR family protein, partial [Candidatus Baltobacteraceae bacterium]|nr:FecR family protein [Candidatus Baltobacteraceae bacterium]